MGSDEDEIIRFPSSTLAQPPNPSTQNTIVASLVASDEQWIPLVISSSGKLPPGLAARGLGFDDESLKHYYFKGFGRNFP